MYDADYPDQMVPISGSVAALTYSGGLTGTAALQYADGCQRLVYFGFPFETIWPAQRPLVMDRVLDYLDACMSSPVDTTILTPAHRSAHRVVPPFEGTAEVGGQAALDRVMVQAERGVDGRYWVGSGWTVEPAWVTATGTVSWSYVLPVLDQSDYHLRAQAWTADGQADGSPAEVTFTYDTLPPTSTVLVTPTGGVHIPAPVSVTLVWQPVGPDGGSPLAYLVALDGAQLYTTTQAAYTVTQLAGGLHTWGVQVLDAAGNRSGWVTDTFWYPSLETRIGTLAHGSAHNVVPPFGGTVDLLREGVVIDRVEVQIRRDSGRDGDASYWTGSEWVSGPALVTGTLWMPGTVWLTGTEPLSPGNAAVSWAYALPPLSDSSYYLSARAWATDGEVDESPAGVAFTYDTLPPTATVLITPTGGVHIGAPLSVTLAWQPVAPDGGSPLAYLVGLDGRRFYTSSQSTYTLTHIVGGRHTWGVQVFDAAGNRSAWVTDTFALDRHTLWLPVLMRSFELRGEVCADVLVNGGFESDEGWALNALAIYATDQFHTGARSVRLGIPPEEPGEYVYSSVAQSVVIPEDVTATLRLWVYPIGEEGDPDDRHYVGLSDGSGDYHSLDAWQSDARAWEERVYDLDDYQGQMVTLYVGTMNDGDDDTAALYVDDVTLEVCP
jgi:hypothetical protein